MSLNEKLCTAAFVAAMGLNGIVTGCSTPQKSQSGTVVSFSENTYKLRIDAYDFAVVNGIFYVEGKEYCRIGKGGRMIINQSTTNPNVFELTMMDDDGKEVTKETIELPYKE